MDSIFFIFPVGNNILFVLILERKSISSSFKCFLFLKATSLKSLIFDIVDILNDVVDVDDLEEVSLKLSELNYYNNTNK